MVIEKFVSGKVKEIYKRMEEKGRMLPDGVTYVNSWIDSQISICYQVMESDSEKKLRDWIDLWSDLADFEFFQVITSSQAKEKILSS